MSRLCLLFALTLLATAAHAADVNRWALGGDTTVTTPVQGNAVLLGGHIQVLAQIGGNLWATGGEVNVQRSVGKNLFAAAGTITLAAPVGGNARAMGGTITLSPGARISGNASIAGDSVRIGAPIEGRLQVGGDDILIDATVNGDVDATGDHIQLGPHAVINGRLRYASAAELQRDPAAQVNGAIEHTSVDTVSWSHRWSRGWSSGSFPDGQTQGWPYVGWQDSFEEWSGEYAHRGLGWLAGVSIVVALLTGALLPGLSRRLGTTVSDSWGWSALLGFLVLVFSPILALILAVTIIGIPIAVAVGAAWLLLVFLGYAASGVALGDIALHQLAPTRYNDTAARILAAALAMLVVIAAARVPMVGGLVFFIALVTGTGALLLQMSRRRAAAQPV